MFSTGEVELKENDEEIFVAALRAMSVKLARDVASQGEGVGKLIECTVGTDISFSFAKEVAKQVINSPLVKTAIHGADPNWGRIVAAIGKAKSDRLVPPDHLKISLMGVPVYQLGSAIAIDKAKLSGLIKAASRVPIDIEIGEPRHSARVFGCDLTEEYVKFNSDYTS